MTESRSGMRLIPTVDIEPGRYATGSRPCPESDAPDAVWDSWFLACLADAGIHELRPIRPRSWLVPAEQLVDPRTIEQIVTVQFDSSLAQVATDPESWRALQGGYVLQKGAELLVEPGCCGDLSNLCEWRRAAGALEESWADLWIGHPWRSTRRLGSRIEISQAHENSQGGEKQPLVVEWQVDAAELTQAVDAACRELVVLADRIRPVVAACIADPASLLSSLVGLDHWRR